MRAKTASVKGRPMDLKPWEGIIQQIVDDWNQQSKEPARKRVLRDRRATLEIEPHGLSHHQIDQIMREVWERLHPQQPNLDG